MTRIALFSDVHGVAQALAAVGEAVAASSPDVVAIAGDLVFNGGDPAATVDGVSGRTPDSGLASQSSWRPASAISNGAHISR